MQCEFLQGLRKQAELVNNMHWFLRCRNLDLDVRPSLMKKEVFELWIGLWLCCRRLRFIGPNPSLYINTMM